MLWYFSLFIIMPNCITQPFIPVLCANHPLHLKWSTHFHLNVVYLSLTPNFFSKLFSRKKFFPSIFICYTTCQLLCQFLVLELFTTFHISISYFIHFIIGAKLNAKISHLELNVYWQYFMTATDPTLSTQTITGHAWQLSTHLGISRIKLWPL